MHDFIEIYIKIVIQIVSFIAPLIVALLSVFSDGVGVMREKANTKMHGIAQLLQDPSKGDFDEKQIKALTQASLESERIGRLLNPKRQILRVFLPLFGAIALIMTSKLHEASFVIPYRNWLYVTLLICSFACTAWAVFVLKQIAWKIIETKEAMSKKEQQKASSSITPILNKESNKQIYK